MLDPWTFRRLWPLVVGIFLCALATSALAGPLRNRPVTLRQPDGTVLRCFVSGDEYFNWIHDAAGYTIIADPDTGYYTYAVLVDGVPRSSPYRAGSIDPELVGLRKYALPRRDKLPALMSDFPATPGARAQTSLVAEDQAPRETDPTDSLLEPEHLVASAEPAPVETLQLSLSLARVAD